MTAVGDRIRSIRGPRTQKAFVASLGITTQALINYERHGCTPKQQILNKISNAYGVNLDGLLTGSGLMNDHCSTSGGVSDDKMADTSAILHQENGQTFGNKGSAKTKTADTSAILPENLTARCLRLADENAGLLRENGDVRVEVEGLRHELERRDDRIAEFERQLVEALKPRGRQAVLAQKGAAAG